MSDWLLRLIWGTVGGILGSIIFNVVKMLI